MYIVFGTQQLVLPEASTMVRNGVVRLRDQLVLVKGTKSVTIKCSW